MSAWGGRAAQETLTWLLSTRPHICCLCGLPIDVKLRGTRHPMRPSTEHRTPRSRNGSNAEANLALAHLSCNSGRGNRHQRRASTVDTSFFSK